MRREYDFSKGTRGKFYRPDATLNIPIYLDREVLAYMSETAKSRGVEVSQLINDILRKNIALTEAVK